jgi:shikimate dehydrogenase
MRAVELAARLNSHFPGNRAGVSESLEEAMRGASGLIQATPVGMAGHPGMPVPESLLDPSLWVSDVVYVPLETPLLAAARGIGCKTVDGGHMNVGQAVRGFKLFTRLEADPARMEAHFRKLAAC